MDHGPGGTGGVAVPSMWDAIGGEPAVGRVLLDRYRVLRKLGSNGGSIWLVRQLDLDIDRVLRVYLPWGFAKPPRFWKESIVGIPRFSHPHLVAVYDVHAIGEGIFLVESEHVEGLTLNRAFVRGVPMPLDWVARILIQFCDALQTAHDHGIVHRDLKPSNLMLVAGRAEGREHLKVLDFGIPEVLDVEEREGEAEPLAGRIMGTPPYMSPEQFLGEADQRSDLYSVGVILYEFLTGHRPFSGPMARMVHDTLHASPPPFATVNPDAKVPAAVEAVVLRCLAKKPEDRPQSAHDLAEQFHRVVAATVAAAPKVAGARGWWLRALAAVRRNWVVS
jgi:serine/threonine-protein kinase